MMHTFSFLTIYGVRKYAAWYDSEEARKVKHKEQNEETKDMYTTERKEAIFNQVAELHQQKSSVSKSSASEMSEQHLESSSNVEQVITSQQQQVQQTTEEQMTEWQKLALKEKKHVEYAQASHFSKVL